LVIHILSMSRPERLLIGLLLVALAGAGWAYYRAQVWQAATLSRITALENRLISSNKQRARDAKKTIGSLSKAVRDNHNLSASVVVLRQAQKIESRTLTIIDTLHRMRQSWQNFGHDVELRQFPNQLNQYLLFIKDFVPDAQMLSHNSAQVEVSSWLNQSGIASEPKPAALALLTKLENQVWQLAAEALENQAQKVIFEGVFDKVGAFAAAASNDVAPGDIYQAQLALVMTTSNASRQFSANGREVPTDPATGQALVQFKVPAARPGQPDTVRAAWHGRVQLPWAAGDTVLETTVPYLIVKPRQR
jgi:hypothetical protein